MTDQRITDDVLAKRAAAAKRGLHSTLIAVMDRLDKPYPDDSRWTPWTRFVRPAMERTDLIVDDLLAEVARLRGVVQTARALIADWAGDNSDNITLVTLPTRLEACLAAVEGLPVPTDTPEHESHCRYHDEIGCASQPRMEPNYNPWVPTDEDTR